LGVATAEGVSATACGAEAGFVAASTDVKSNDPLTLSVLRLGGGVEGGVGEVTTRGAAADLAANFCLLKPARRDSAVDDTEDEIMFAVADGVVVELFSGDDTCFGGVGGRVGEWSAFFLGFSAGDLRGELSSSDSSSLLGFLGVVAFPDVRGASSSESLCFFGFSGVFGLPDAVFGFWENAFGDGNSSKSITTISALDLAFTLSFTDPLMGAGVDCFGVVDLLILWIASCSSAPYY
jgi:hypothetical protein